MKKITILAISFLLLGAGCAKGENIEDTQSDSVALEGVEVQIEGIGGSSVAIEILGEDDLPVKSVDMTLTDNQFDPASIAVEAGQRVQINLTGFGDGSVFTIDDIGLHEEIINGETVSFTAPEAGGQYRFYSELDGLEGILHVKEL